MIALDKQAHFFSGAVITFSVAAFGFPVIGLAIALIAAILKEVYDSFHPDNHTKDVWDAMATTVGGLYAFLVVLLPTWIK